MSKKLLTGSLAMLAMLAFSPPALAEAEAETRTIAEMFLWSPDPLGLIIIWFLLLISAMTMGFIIKLVIDNRRTVLVPDDVVEQLETMLQEKRYREAIEFAANDPSYVARVVSAGLHEASNGYPAMERAMEETSDAETTRMLRPIEYLNVVGNVSPMLGLFGTVYGMIRAFQTLVELGGRPDPAKLADGISTALVTTFWGLVVAMPALVAYALIRNRVDATTAEGLMTAESLIRPFKPSGGGRRPSGTTQAGTDAGRASRSASPRPEKDS